MEVMGLSRRAAEVRVLTSQRLVTDRILSYRRLFHLLGTVWLDDSNTTPIASAAAHHGRQSARVDVCLPPNRCTTNSRRLASQELYDLTPLPDSIPKVKELGSSSAPLMSAAYFIGARCRVFNDDYMKCKEDAEGRGELECMREGRKVTRCARSVYDFFIMDYCLTCSG
jgi:hypothetical protein